MLGRRLPAVVLGLIAVAATAYAVTLPVPESKSDGRTTGIFWSDEATYHSMAYSLAFDADLRYDRGDLERVYAAGYAGGPSGLFLVKNPDDGLTYYAKAFAYSLAAAPLVRGFGDNGFFLLHAVLLGLMLAAGYAYAVRATAPGHASLWTVTYVLGSVATLYFFWITPEWFNLAIIFLATFLWLYKEGPPDNSATRPAVGWLCGPWTDVAAAVLYGIAIYSKPPNVLLVAPLVLWQVARGRWLRGVALATVCALVIASFFLVTASAIGDWNYQGGDRRTFTAQTSYPYLDQDKTFENVGESMTTSVAELFALPAPGTLARDLVYVWVGRNGGILPYMFPAVMALLLFATAPGRTMRSPHTLLVLFWLVEILAIIVAVKGNWIGGGGTIGSRYFVNAYPVLFFALPAGASLLAAAASWVVWGLFLSHVVLAPFTSSLQPSRHTKSMPFTALPTELTILHNLPFNTNRNTRRVQMQEQPTYLLYFLDDNTWLREGRGELLGFWVKGGRRAELVVRTTEPIETIRLRVRNRGKPNDVTVRHAGSLERRRIEPNQAIDIELDTGWAVEYLGTSLYLVSIASEASTIPLFDTPGSPDHRNLGVFVQLEVAPEHVIES